jgi:hypothetical protein
VLIAARSIEATEVAAFCAAIRAESVMIDGPDGSAVAIAMSVNPRLFVYDTSIMPGKSVLAICSALADAGCQCAMLAVAEKADANHGDVFLLQLLCGTLSPTPLWLRVDPHSTRGLDPVLVGVPRPG